jgi:glycosyltransferase involved in cell wall biosynthesis
MSIAINFNFSKFSKDINGDIQYQVNLIKYLNYNNYSINLGTFGLSTIFSEFVLFAGKILIRLFKKSDLLNRYSTLVYRNYNYSFNKNYKIIFSHYFFPFFEKKKVIIFSSMGVVYQKYFKEYGNTITFKSDIYFHKYIDKKYNVIFLIWDEKFAIRTKKICSIKSPIKILPPVLGIDEKVNKNITTQVSKNIKILFIGRNHNIKGLKYLLEAICNKKLEKYDFHLDIITSKIIDPKNKRINIFNSVDENFKNRLLKNADIFILPTLADTFGYSLLEAIAYKCAIITSNFYPINKFCKNNSNGFLVRPKKSEDIFRCLNILLKDPQKIQKFKKNSYKLYKGNYSQKLFKKKFDNICNEIKTNKISSDI